MRQSGMRESASAPAHFLLRLLLSTVLLPILAILTLGCSLLFTAVRAIYAGGAISAVVTAIRDLCLL